MTPEKIWKEWNTSRAFISLVLLGFRLMWLHSDTWAGSYHGELRIEVSQNQFPIIHTDSVKPDVSWKFSKLFPKSCLTSWVRSRADTAQNWVPNLMLTGSSILIVSKSFNTKQKVSSIKSKDWFLQWRERRQDFSCNPFIMTPGIPEQGLKHLKILQYGDHGSKPSRNRSHHLLMSISRKTVCSYTH